MQKALSKDVEYLVTTLPDAYRPSSNITKYITLNPLTNGKIVIGADGQIKITPYVAMSAGSAINMDECFLAKVP